MQGIQICTMYMYYTIVVAKLDNARREKMGTKRHKGVENLDT